jgi:phenylpropionate dioxygenase-like ring-hydroxylating dioxygenase large terminal subunit
MFLQDNWYVAAFGADVAAKPVARKICGKPVVLFRTAGGEAVALEDRCIHRGMPLSQGGECEGEIIRCPYHGLEFGKTGRCVKIPGQAVVPDSAAVLHYPMVEQDALLWIWMGNRAKADALRIPRHPEHVDGKWAWTPLMLEIEADWQLLNDNLLDLTHLGLVHRKTIGGNMQAHATATMRTTKTERGVLVTRWLPDSAPPPQYLQARSFAGNIERWQEIDFIPGFIRLWSGGTDAGTGAFEGRREGGVQFMGMHAITPATTTRCYYHFTQSRNFALEDRELEARLHKGAADTLLEDKVIIEAQQARLLETPDRPLTDIQADAGGLQARRVVRHLAELEVQ